EVLEVPIEIVKEVVTRVAPGISKRNDVKEIEFANAPTDERLEHLGQVLDVLLVDDDVDVDDEAPGRERSLEPRRLLDESARRADQGVVKFRGVPVKRKGDLVETVVPGTLEERRIVEHPPVRDRLHFAVAGALAELHEVEEVRVHRRLAARENEPIRA